MEERPAWPPPAYGDYEVREARRGRGRETVRGENIVEDNYVVLGHEHFFFPMNGERADEARFTGVL